ncbi:hypothetical protein [uncultured Ellagibacter sp.]|uniref:hypothetical protein n=1 Tax=uncultured Ellagibacter sp. TaxID=2137580 RepID=UPI00260BE8F7|nr:hypothetical protein [uncultured Ellagibacter sp.]
MHNKEENERKLASTRKLIMFANIAGPVSLIIGGVLLSTAGLICSLIARSRINVLIRQQPQDQVFTEKVMQVAKPGAIALIICSIALVLNIISLALVMPAVLEAAQTDSLQTLFGGGAINTAGSATSTWG